MDAGADVKRNSMKIRTRAGMRRRLKNATASMSSYGARAAVDAADMAGGMTRRCSGAANGNVEMVRAFLAKGADPNALSAPFHRTAREGTGRLPSANSRR